MNKFDYISNTSEKVIEYLVDRRFEITEEDMSFIRITINEANSSSWEEGTRSNGCDCGQVGCPVCTP
jgi:hypothetical protein